VRRVGSIYLAAPSSIWTISVLGADYELSCSSSPELTRLSKVKTFHIVPTMNDMQKLGTKYERAGGGKGWAEGNGGGL